MGFTSARGVQPVSEDITSRIDNSVNKVSVGRVYDYLLGGTHNYAADRAFAEKQIAAFPHLTNFARANRAFLGRAVRYAISQGISQFVDIGSGLPTQGNVHEVADEAAPGRARVVYIDNEPLAHAHSQILLEKTADPGRHFALDADFFDVTEVWPRVLETGIDPKEPICLLTVALLHFMPPETAPDATLEQYRRLLAPESLLVLSHGSTDGGDAKAQAAAAEVSNAYESQTTSAARPRTRDEIAEFFGDFELVSPGLVWLPEWRPEKPLRGRPEASYGLAGVARKV